MERKFLATTVLCLITLFAISPGANAQEWKKIPGPWLWMIVPTDPGKGGADSIKTDSLKLASGDQVTEDIVANNGANEDEQAGSYQWRVGFIDVEPPGFADVLFGEGNINKTIGTIYNVGDLDDYTSYALITVHSVIEQQGKIGISSDDACKIWLNGDEVGTVEENRRANAKNFQNKFDIKLKKGPNLLMIKVSERAGKWAMYVGLNVPELDLITLKQTTRSMPFLPLVEPLPEEVHLRKISGDAYISEEHKDPSFVVEVQDTEGNPMPGVYVKFQIQNSSTLPDDIIQSAVFEPKIALTDAAGRARTTLRLQPLEGESGTIKILAYVPKDPKATDPIDKESIADPVTFLATTEKKKTIHIKGPWLWMIAEGGPPDSINDDLLSEQYKFVNESQIAQQSASSNGAYEDAYTGKREIKKNGESVYWTKGELNEDGNVNECLIQNRMLQGPVDNYTAYALISVYSAWREWQGVILRVGSDDGVKVWLNGVDVYTYDQTRSSDGYQDEIPVSLNLGYNLLMVKVSDHNDGWGLFIGLDVPTEADIKVEPLVTPAEEWQLQTKHPLTMPPNPPISQVAFGKESTYFVFTTNFPRFEDSPYKDAIIYDDCLIELDIGEENVSGFIFPLFETHESAKEVIGKKGIQGLSIIAGAGAGTVVTATVTIMSPVGPFLAGAAAAAMVTWLVERSLTEHFFPEEKDPTLEDSTFYLDVDGPLDADTWAGRTPSPPSGWASDYLVKVNRPLEEMKIKVEQLYRFTFEETTEETPRLRLTSYERTCNLKEIYEKENGVLEAPGAQPMSLSDYPPFQQLPPEIQEYLLQHFREFETTKEWQIPEVTSLLPNYPNPFNPETWVPYQLAESANVTLTIYDIQGHVVRDLDLGHQRAGMYHSRSRAAHWDGRNTVGEPVASGLYFYTLKAGDFAATRKMLIRK